MPMLTQTLLVIRRELLLASRQRSDWLNPLLFFLIVITLFPLGLGPAVVAIKLLLPGLIWIAALLANLLALPRLFAEDVSDGSLEQWLLVPHAIMPFIYAKLLAQWLLTGLPLLLLTPLLGLMLHLPTDAVFMLLVSLLLGTPILLLTGAIYMALSLSVRQQSLLLPLLVLPAYVPVLIFGTGAVLAVLQGQSPQMALAVLAALLLLALALAPRAIAAALRIGMN